MWQHIIIAQAAGEGGFISTLVMMAVIFGIFWLLVFRPQKKRQEEHQSFLKALKKGDEVVTAGGLFGTVEKVDDQIVTLRVSRDAKVKVLRQQIEGSQASHLADEEEEEATEEKEEKEDKEEKAS